MAKEILVVEYQVRQEHAGFLKGPLTKRIEENQHLRGRVRLQLIGNSLRIFADINDNTIQNAVKQAVETLSHRTEHGFVEIYHHHEQDDSGLDARAIDSINRAAALEARVAQLSQQIAASEGAAKDYDALNERKTHLEKTVADLTTKLTSAQEELTIYAELSKEAEQKIDKLTTQLTSAQENLTRSTDANKWLEQRISELTAKITSLQEEHKNIDKKSEQKIAELTAQVITLENTARTYEGINNENLALKEELENLKQHPRPSYEHRVHVLDEFSEREDIQKGKYDPGKVLAKLEGLSISTARRSVEDIIIMICNATADPKTKIKLGDDYDDSHPAEFARYQMYLRCIKEREEELKQLKKDGRGSDVLNLLDGELKQARENTDAYVSEKDKFIEDSIENLVKARKSLDDIDAIPVYVQLKEQDEAYTVTVHLPLKKGKTELHRLLSSDRIFQRIPEKLAKNVAAKEDGTIFYELNMPKKEFGSADAEEMTAAVRKTLSSLYSTTVERFGLGISVSYDEELRFKIGNSKK